MTRNARIGFLVAAVVVLVIAFVLIGMEGKADAPRPADAPTTTAAPAAGRGGRQSEAEPQPTPTAPPIPRIVIKNGEPQGGIEEIEVDKGDRVRFVVMADAPEEVHAHGYDIMKDVGPDMPASFDFKATTDGIYEVELENAGVQIVKLQVNP